MNLINLIHSKSTRLASANTALFALLWIGLIVSPCVSAMLVATSDHDCPRCPPPPCHEVQLEQCEDPDSLDAPRAGEEVELPVLFLPAQAPAWAADVQPAHAAPPRPHAPIRAGPRPHLLFQTFNE